MASSHQTFGSCSESKVPAAAHETYQRITEGVQRAQWLRAAILGANDGLLSTTSLMLGIGAAKDDRWSMIVSGLAGALAGACSMAVGEFVSVSTQKDIEQATAARCISKPDTADIEHEHVQNLDVMEKRTSPVIVLDPKLTQVLSPGRSPIIKVITNDLKLVQNQLEEAVLPNPYKAAAASALSFLCGSIVPVASAAPIAENVIRIVVIAVVTSIALALFGGLGAFLGGSPVRVSAGRILVGGWIAMAITCALLKPFDTDHEGRHSD